MKLIREFKTGARGESQREFAARHGVKVQTFRGWPYRRRRADGAARRAPRLVPPVRVVASTAPPARKETEAAAAIEAALPSGLRVSCAAALGAEFIADVLRRLG